MEKVEFGQIIVSEIDRLKKEYDALKNKVSFLEKINSASNQDEINATNYRINLIGKKLDRIYLIVGIEAKIRYEKMSETELQSIKDDDINTRTKDLENDRQKYNENEKLIGQLRGQLNELAMKGDFSPVAMENGKKIQNEIDFLNNQNYKVREEITKKEQELQEIKYRSLEDLRKKLIEDNGITLDVDEFIKLNENSIPIATMAEDRTKAVELAQTRGSYNSIKKNKEQLKVSNTYRLSDLPKDAMAEIAREFRQNSNWIEISDPERLEALLNILKNHIASQKAILQNEYTDKNLKPIIGVFITNGSANPDIEYIEEFYKNHPDYRCMEKVNGLKEAIQERDRQNKKLFKTGVTKDIINGLNSDIAFTSQSLLVTIARYYEKRFNFHYFNSINSAITNTLNLSSHEEVKKSIERALKNIEQYEKAIADLEKQIEQHKNQIKSKSDDLEKEKNDALEKIKELTGREEKYVNSVGDQFEHVTDEAAQGYKVQLLKNIQVAAQKEADIKEAELKGMTLDQLYEWKKQLTENKAQEIAPNEATEETPKHL